MCITDNNYLNIIDKLSYKLWRFAAQNKSISNQQDNTASCITTTTWTPNKIIIVLLLVYSRLTTKQICDERDHTYNIKHINDWWGQTATSCPAPLHLSYLLMEVVEITVAVLHGPLVLSICHLDDVDLKKKRPSGITTWLCEQAEIENEVHFLFCCPVYDDVRNKSFLKMSSINADFLWLDDYE